MENTYNNIDTEVIDDGSEIKQNCVVESLPQCSQSTEPVFFLHHDSSLSNTQLSSQIQETNINKNIPGHSQTDTNAHLPMQIQVSNLEVGANTIIPSNYYGEDGKTSRIYVTSIVSNELKDVNFLTDKQDSKEIIVLQQYPDFGETSVCPSAKVPDKYSDNKKDIQRSFGPQKEKFNNLKDGSKQLENTCHNKQIDDCNNTPSSKNKQVKSGTNNTTGCMTMKVFYGNCVANNHQVKQNICESGKINDVDVNAGNNGKKCNNVVVNSDEIVIDGVAVTEEVTVATDNEHICIEKGVSSFSLYTCGACRLKFVTLCKLHDHFERQHFTGSYIYFQNTKIVFPRLENESKVTQTDLTDLIEVYETRFENDEIGGIDNVESGSDGIPNENVEKIDGTTETGIDAADNFKTVKVTKSKDRKKKNKEKSNSRKKSVDIKVLHKKKQHSSLKINVNQKEMLKKKSRKQKEVIPDQKSSDDFDELKSLNNTLVDIETDVEGENNDSQSELAFPEEANEINEASDISTSENFTSVSSYSENSRTLKSREKDLSNQSKRKHSEIRIRDPNKKTRVIDADKDSSIHKCNICATKYVSKVKLQYHLTKVHKKANTESEKQCRWCGSTFPGTKSYLSHVRQCENNEHLMCLICNTRFDSRKIVNDHLLNHRKESELKCRVCDRMFTSAVTMQSHLRRHNLRKDLQCEHCGKSFYYHNLLKKHKLYCNQEPEVECPQCSVKFKTQECLKHHMTVHSNDRPFICHVCGYAGWYINYIL